jgi:hypothetical protein
MVLTKFYACLIRQDKIDPSDQTKDHLPLLLGQDPTVMPVWPIMGMNHVSGGNGCQTIENGNLQSG